MAQTRFKTSISLGGQVIKQLKLEAKASRHSMSQVIEMLIEEALAARREKAAQKKIEAECLGKAAIDEKSSPPAPAATDQQQPQPSLSPEEEQQLKIRSA